MPLCWLPLRQGPQVEAGLPCAQAQCTGSTCIGIYPVDSQLQHRKNLEACGSPVAHPGEPHQFTCAKGGWRILKVCDADAMCMGQIHCICRDHPGSCSKPCRLFEHTFIYVGGTHCLLTVSDPLLSLPWISGRLIFRVITC